MEPFDISKLKVGGNEGKVKTTENFQKVFEQNNKKNQYLKSFSQVRLQPLSLRKGSMDDTRRESPLQRIKAKQPPGQAQQASKLDVLASLQGNKMQVILTKETEKEQTDEKKKSKREPLDPMDFVKQMM